ncbi:MAG: MMPL family transporter [Mobilicoccus sp.]|nr:MMPL family transporter [Mobilicoccus sp.]
MSEALFDLGRFCFRHARAVLAAWLFTLVLLGAFAGLLGQGTTEIYSIPGSSGQQALDDLEGRFPEVAGTHAQVIVETPEGRTVTDERARADVADLVDRLEAIPGVTGVTDPYADEVSGALSDDGRAVLVSAQLEGEQTQIEQRTLDALLASVDPLRDAGYVAEVGGGAFVGDVPSISVLELVGLAIAFIVLYALFRSLRASVLPIVTAVLGAGVTLAVIFIATAVIDVPGTGPLLALMISVAVGIDYALFILSRHRDQMAEGVDAEESTAVAIATAGGAIVFAGLTTLVALLGLVLAGLPFLSVMGVSAAGGVAVAVVGAVTLLPALMGVLGDRIAPRHVRRSVAADEGDAAPAVEGETSEDLGEHDADEHGLTRDDQLAHERGEPAAKESSTSPAASWGLRWVQIVTWKPILTVVLVTASLVALALPVTDLRLALPDNGGMPVSESPRRAYDLVSEHFGPGANGQLVVTVDVVASEDPLGLIEDIEAEVAAVPGIREIQLATPNPSVDTGVIFAVPETGPMEDATSELVRDLRDRLPQWEERYDTRLAVTGQTAIQIDVSDRLGAATLPFALVVLGFALLLLMVMFRSIIVPLTATIGFALSTVAAFGVVTMVFEYGWASDLLQVDRLGPIISFLPIILMGVMFGLAMDYQVFLVSRMREAFVRGVPAREAVTAGFVSSSRVVLAAAVIMIAVFAGFVPGGDMNLQPIALGLTVGVFLDALVVRMILIPAVMQLAGERAWWFPRFLERLLPTVDVEGDVVYRHLERSRLERPHPQRVLEARGAGVDGPQGPVFGDLDLDLDEGHIAVLQGPDGAGKTSALLTLAGRMPLSTGTVEIGGYLLPDQTSRVQALVALAEIPGINDLDRALTLRSHIAERLATRTLLPWARPRDVQGVLAHLRDACAAASHAVPGVLPERELHADTRVEDLTDLERALFGVVLALVGAPPVLVVDETRLQARAERRALIAAAGWFIETAPRPLSVLASSTDQVDARRLADIAGLGPDTVQVVTLTRPGPRPVRPDTSSDASDPIEVA